MQRSWEFTIRRGASCPAVSVEVIKTDIRDVKGPVKRFQGMP